MVSMRGHMGSAFFDCCMLVLSPSRRMVTRSWITLYTSWCSLSALSRAGGYRMRKTFPEVSSQVMKTFKVEKSIAIFSTYVCVYHFSRFKLNVNW